VNVDLVVIDGPNLFSRVAEIVRAVAGDAAVAHEYMSDWFDVDRFVYETLDFGSAPHLGIVVFHSLRTLGRESSARISGNDKVDAFWARQAALPNTSCIVVDIPGDQQDTFHFECSKCKEANHVKSGTEKGVDTSIATYLFETVDRWDSVCIFTQDVDFVPPLLALRRRGRQVYVSTEPTSALPTALVRAAQSFIPLDREFLASDLCWLRIARHGAFSTFASSLSSAGHATKILGRRTELQYIDDVRAPVYGGEVRVESCDKAIAAAGLQSIARFDRSVHHGNDGRAMPGIRFHLTGSTLMGLQRRPADLEKVKAMLGDW
jgi:uncharacterized LabA/DUF88 family protein